MGLARGIFFCFSSLISATFSDLWRLFYTKNVEISEEFMQILKSSCFRAPKKVAPLARADLYRSLEGSFSAGSTATIATKYSFFQIFRDLQNYLSKSSKILQKFVKNQRFSQKSALFCKNPEISQKFCKILRFLAIFCKKFATFSKNQLDSFVDLEKPEKMI